MQLQRRCKCLPSTPANGFYCFTTNLCNFDELATTILLHIHVKTFGLNFQRLAEKFRVAQRKKNTKSETFAKNFRRKRAKTQRPEVEEPSKAVRMCILKTIFFLPYTTAPNLAFTKMTHKFRLFFKLCYLDHPVLRPHIPLRSLPHSQPFFLLLHQPRCSRARHQPS